MNFLFFNFRNRCRLSKHSVCITCHHYCVALSHATYIGDVFKMLFLRLHWSDLIHVLSLKVGIRLILSVVGRGHHGHCINVDWSPLYAPAESSSSSLLTSVVRKLTDENPTDVALRSFNRQEGGEGDVHQLTAIKIFRSPRKSFFVSIDSDDCLWRLARRCAWRCTCYILDASESSKTFPRLQT